MTRVLIAYASKYGSVEEVARYVGAVLRDRGASCAVTPAREAEEVVGYDLVVLGTGLYMGRLHRDARRFLTSAPRGARAHALRRVRDGAAQRRAGGEGEGAAARCSAASTATRASLPERSRSSAG